MEIKRINTCNNEIVERIVLIHLSVLNDSFLNNFGEKFLKVIYCNLIESRETICLVLFENNKIEGFALASTDYSKFLSTAMKKGKFSILLSMMKCFILRPVVLYSLLKSVPKILFSKETPHAELQFLGVSPESQGKGFGQAIMKRLDEEFKKENISQFYVGTKARDPLSNKFYQKIGFTKEYSKTYFDDVLNYYLSPKE